MDSNISFDKIIVLIFTSLLAFSCSERIDNVEHEFVLSENLIDSTFQDSSKTLDSAFFIVSDFHGDIKEDSILLSWNINDISSLKHIRGYIIIYGNDSSYVATEKPDSLFMTDSIVLRNYTLSNHIEIRRFLFMPDYSKIYLKIIPSFDDTIKNIISSRVFCIQNRSLIYPAEDDEAIKQDTVLLPSMKYKYLSPDSLRFIHDYYRIYDTVKIKFYFSNPYGHPMTLSYKRTSAADDFNFADSVLTIIPRKVKPGEYSGGYVKIADYINDVSVSYLVDYKILENHPPIITTEYSGPSKLKHGEIIEVPLKIKDPDSTWFMEQGDPFILSYSHGSTADNLCGNIIVINGNDADPGTYTAVVTATDKGGASANFNFTYTIVENRSPIITTDFSGSTSLKVSDTLNVPIKIYDPDGDTFNVAYKNGSSADSFSNDCIRIIGSNAGSGTYTSVITVTDESGSSSEFRFNYTILANKAPIINISNTENPVISRKNEISVPISIQDPEGHPFNISYRRGSAADYLKDSTIIINGSMAQPGTYTIYITAKDFYGASSESSFTYIIKKEDPIKNSSPVMIKDPSNILLSAKGEAFTLSMSDYFKDPDDDVLDYTFSVSDPDVLGLDYVNDVLSGTAKSDGKAIVTVTATDTFGATVAISFEVSVLSTPFVIFPTSVSKTTSIKINAESLTSLEVSIYSQTGSEVLKQTVHASAFESALIDVSKLAPGRYNVKLKFNGQEYSQNITKK